MKRILLWMVMIGCGFAAPASAYTDQVTVRAEEVWAAAKEVVKQKKFEKIDEKNMVLETKWTQDRVIRSRGLLKGIASQSYERRYRITIKVVQRDYDTEVTITGKFQERPVETNQHLILWRKYRPEGSDFDIERQTFMQILNRLQLNRTGVSTP